MGDPKARTFEDRMAAVSGLPIDFRGHQMNDERGRSKIALFVALSRVLDSLKPGDAPVEVVDDLGLCKCPNCDGDLRVMGDGTRLWIDPPCPHPEGIHETVFDLNVPSGKLVVANDLRTLFPVLDDHFDINRFIGCHRTTLAYATQAGLAHGFVGNTCPGLYQWEGKQDAYLIANPGAKEKWDPEKKSYFPCEPGPFDGGEDLAGICTDLWWYSICDADEFARRCAWKGISVEDALIEYSAKVVEVTPGAYRFTHLYPRDGYGPKAVYYTRIERVGEAKPVQDYLGEYLGQQMTVQQYLYTCLRRWPTLFLPRKNRSNLAGLTPEEWARALARAADQCLIVLGNGVDWHPNGFPMETVLPDTPEFEVPRFHFQAHWYPLGEGAALSLAAGIIPAWFHDDQPIHLAPDFARLAFNVLESIIRFGVEPHYSADKWEEEIARVRHSMQHAVECYYRLKERYPDCSYPDFDAWMADRATVEKWVKEFPFTKPDKPPNPMEDLE